MRKALSTFLGVLLHYVTYADVYGSTPDVVLYGGGGHR